MQVIEQYPLKDLSGDRKSIGAFLKDRFGEQFFAFYKGSFQEGNIKVRTITKLSTIPLGNNEGIDYKKIEARGGVVSDLNLWNGDADERIIGREIYHTLRNLEAGVQKL